MIDQVLFALDTNVIVYAEGYGNDYRNDRARTLVEALGQSRLILPTQVLGEAYNVLVRKQGRSRQLAAAAVRQWLTLTTLHSADEATFAAAIDLATTHNLQFWDALILATASDAGCRLLLSEDLADGFVWRGCTVADPFRATMHPLLADALERQ